MHAKAASVSELIPRHAINVKVNLMELLVLMETHALSAILVKEASANLERLTHVLPTNAITQAHATRPQVFATTQLKLMELHAMMEMHARNLIPVKVESVLELIL